MPQRSRLSVHQCSYVLALSDLAGTPPMNASAARADSGSTRKRFATPSIVVRRSAIWSRRPRTAPSALGASTSLCTAGVALRHLELGGDLLEAQGLLVRHEEGVHPGDRAVDAPERAHRAPGFDELPDGLVLHRAFRIFRTTFYVKGARWAGAKGLASARQPRPNRGPIFRLHRARADLSGALLQLRDHASAASVSVPSSRLRISSVPPGGRGCVTSSRRPGRRGVIGSSMIDEA